MKIPDYELMMIQKLAQEALAIVTDKTTALSPDTRFERLALLVQDHGFPLIAELHKIAHESRRAELVASLAAELLPWEAAGDQAAADRAVLAARQLVTAAESNNQRGEA